MLGALAMGSDPQRHRFFIGAQGAHLAHSIGATLEAIGGPQTGAVFVKPNFTYPFEKPGVTTTRAFLVALVEALVDRGVERICIGEGEGGYNAFSMDKTFAAFRLEDLERRYGIEVANVSHWPSREFLVPARGRSYRVRFPSPVLDDFDAVVSVPVPKVHCMTTISGAAKNLWGLLQDNMRLQLHPALPQILCQVTSALPPALAVCDGTHGLTRNGPMVDGVTIGLGWVAGSDDLWLHDLMMCKLMRMPEGKVGHLAYARARGVAPAVEKCDIVPGWEAFVDNRFYLRKNAWNRVAKAAWYSPALNQLIYTSKASGILHKAMYTVRRKSPDLLARGVDWD
ncbi:MAG TPA: DUF362 domain-containing protein [Acidimicrobiales bacterium]|nr:DUF362 domain-containing protein [Acidimicrobiales bacterium]